MTKRRFYNLFLGLILLISLNGCVSAAARDATRSAIEEAETQVRLRWSEEWRPALMEEVGELTVAARDEAVRQAVIQLEQYKTENTGRLERIGVQVENFDTNRDGQVSGAETLALLQEIKAKNESSPNPLEWWEILLAVGAAYVPLTGAKELARKKMNGTGDGTTTPA